ncbi:MAG TPA: hypothetical protein ENI54_06680 [bacterium]|nr:hypothetical protein [bacterium]
MNSIKILLAQTSPVVGDLKKNIENHLDIISKAKDEGVSLVVFPELSLTGYFLKDSVYDIGININNREDALVLEPIFKASMDLNMSIIAGFIEKDEDYNFYNSSLCVSDGKIIHVHRKVYLPTYGMFEESRYFKPGGEFGVFDIGGIKTSILTCEDAWHLSSSYIAINKGAHVIIVNSASPTRGIVEGLNRFSSINMWEELLSVIAFYYKSYVIYVNRVGYEDGIGFSGGSCIFNPSGEMERMMDYLEEGTMKVEINLDVLNIERFKTPLIRDENLNLTMKEIEGILNEKRTS